jgi:predicted RNase H-like HicB family nuclease
MEPFHLDPFPPIASLPPGWERRRVLVSRKGTWWTARVPSLPQCVAHGASRQEAVQKVQAMVAQVREEARRLGGSLPEEYESLDVAVLPA